MDAAGGAAIGLDDVMARFRVAPEAPMRDVLAVIERNGEGIALVVDEDHRLLGIVTDGDVRRALLANADFGRSAGAFVAAGGRKAPLTAPTGTPAEECRRRMEARLVRHLPLIDADGRVAGLALLDAYARDAALPLRAVVMAGGFGRRLRPLTAGTPKPLLKIGDKPVIEHIVGQLRDAGVRRVNVTTHYQADKIRAHLGDGSGLGIEVRYTHEDEPLGTAGALAMLEPDADGHPLLVINGDVLTAVDFRAMLGFHREHRADVTIGVRRYEVPVPFGVVEAEGARVVRLVEKPSLSFFINAGVYLLEQRVLALIEKGRRLDMTDLIQRLMDGAGAVASFPIHEYWIDIGQVGDYTQAMSDVAAGKIRP